MRTKEVSTVSRVQGKEGEAHRPARELVGEGDGAYGLARRREHLIRGRGRGRVRIRGRVRVGLP